MATTPLPARELSAWHDPEHAEEPDTFPALRGDRRVDVAVVGAGITGLTTAVLLAREGLQVAVLEARRIGAVASGNTTAKISLLQGTRAATLDHRHSQETVDAYLAAHRAGFDWLLDRARRADCDLERRASVTFATDGRSSAAAETIRREAAVLRRAGFPAQLGTEVGLPFEVSEAVTLADQAQFDPMPYLADLAQELHESGHLVYEHTRVRSVSLLGAPRLRTEHGEVRAERVVLATGVPILDRGLYFARVEPSRSYAQAVRVDGPLPPAMYLSADQPGVSLRTAVIEGRSGCSPAASATGWAPARRRRRTSRTLPTGRRSGSRSERSPTAGPPRTTCPRTACRSWGRCRGSHGSWSRRGSRSGA